MSAAAQAAAPPRPAWADEALLRAFKSLGIVIEIDPETSSLCPDLDRLGLWVRVWEAWFRDASGLSQGARRHLQYRRDVAIVTDLTADELCALAPLGRVCQDLGLGFSAGMRMSGALAAPDRLIDGLSGGWLSAVSLIHDGNGAPDAEATEALMRRLEAARVQVRLAGDPVAWLASGLMDRPYLNAANVTLDSRARTGPSARTGCLPLLRVFVDSTGALYPCLGLLGVRAACLGHIDSGDAGLAFYRTPTLDLEALAMRGPAQEERATPAVPLGLPPVCEAHRAYLIAGAED